jgi:pSer/pThr/pTyr-binding forkhead associated (FHA) protein
MSEIQQSTFIIKREDRNEDPKTTQGEGLRIGRLPDSDIWLNNPKVSRLHAGINEVEGYFYLINLSASSATTLNSRVIPFNEAEALTEGDEIQIGPYFLQVEYIDSISETIGIRVTQEFAFSVGDREPSHKSEAHERQVSGRLTGKLKLPTGALPTAEHATGQSGPLTEVTNALKVFWGKRTREKAGRPSPLHPQRPPHLGKMRFNWVPTRDLIRPWPFAVFIWALLGVVTLSALAAFAHKDTFAPAAISDPHTRKAFSLTPAIARQTNGGACTSCHAVGVSVVNREKMEANCSACHQTEAFVATVIPAHRAAGISCTGCHAEHRGETFRPVNAALEACAKCHNDENKKLYNGKSVHTPHGGTFGYPVVNGLWIWKGLDEEELAQKPEIVAFLKRNRVNSSQIQEWRNAQFHAIHVEHIRTVAGIVGIVDDNGNEVLSCSSCHRTGYMGANVDRTYPWTTCGKCHNAAVFNEPSTSTVRVETPSCTSCHVQHVKDIHWAASLRVDQPQHSATPEKK